MSADPFAGLQPETMWKHFSAITKIARPSGQEEAVKAYVLQWAQSLGFEVKHDEIGNLCVHVPASPGKEASPVVVIQGHLDMVCERDSDSPNDAEQGKIEVVLEDGWIKAVGTTLGADNAIGVVAGMAAAEDKDVVHGPLDLLMTIDEETGMTGAIELDPSIVRGRVMLNLDSEEDGTLYAGCAGGCDTKMALQMDPQDLPADHVAFRVAISGLKGGHSGLDINTNRLNSIRAMARVLQQAASATGLLLYSIEGGSKRNAIPRESVAVVCVPKSEVPGLRTAAETARDALLLQYAGLDDGLEIKFEEVDAPAKTFSRIDTSRALRLLRGIPSGVIAMSQELPGLVETSTNLGVVTTEADTIHTISCSRSSVAPALRDVLDTLGSVGTLAGANVVEHGGYPGWKPDMESHVLHLTLRAAERLFGKTPDVTAIHAGLECGLLGERIPGMDMVSFGPDIRSAHAPGERVNVETVGNFWALLKELLKDLS